ISVVRLRLASNGKTLLRRSAGVRMVKPVLPPPDWPDLAKVVEDLVPGDMTQLDERKASLVEDLGRARGNERATLAVRLQVLGASYTTMGSDAYRLPMSYECMLDGDAVVALESVGSPQRIDEVAPWSFRFIFTRWDYDAMSGVMAGSLSVPLQ